MTELFEPGSPLDWRLTTAASGLLAEANAAHLLTSADLHVATRLGALGGEADERVLLAVALAVRAVRRGSVCVSLAEAPAGAPELAWPDPEAWVAAVLASPLVTAGAVRWDGGRLYLDRYHRLEVQVCDDLLERAARPVPAVDETVLADALLAVGGEHFSVEQQQAAVEALGRWTTVLTGGPGTGKTTTVARVLVLLAAQAEARGERLSIALAAPTGKAATRLEEAVSSELAEVARTAPEVSGPVGRPAGVTLHRLLGWRPDSSTRFRHHRANRLKHDVVVVDECSMVDLTMMGRLLEAVRPETRLLLVGDADQLTSVGAGAVLSDLVDGLGAASGGSQVASLSRNYRSEHDILALAEALRAGDADEALKVLRSTSDQVELVEADDPAATEEALREQCLGTALAVRGAALDGRPEEALAQLDRHRLLCAHRDGPRGVRHWNRQVERWLAETPGVEVLGQWYPGRPLLVTSNDYALDVYNGEIGVVVNLGPRPRAYISGSEGLKALAPGRLDAVETMHAMTIHKSQGSQADRVTVLLPEADSRLLTRELFYTAVTRAKRHVRVVGSEASVRAAVGNQASRATGLGARLKGDTSL